jgi:hypothetical protein
VHRDLSDVAAIDQTLDQLTREEPALREIFRSAGEHSAG